MKVCCKILFVHAILLLMGVVVKYPIIFHVYNAGDILLLENTLVTQWKNHIGVHHHLIQNNVEDGTVKIIFSVQKKTSQIHLPRT